VQKGGIHRWKKGWNRTYKSVAKKRQLQWTEKQVEIADLLKQGVLPQDVIARGVGNKNLVYRVKEALDAGGGPGVVETGVEKTGGQSTTKETGPFSDPEADTKVRYRTLDTIEVGAIQIEPADWRINQFGALLILGTYEHAKAAFRYDGTVGEFLCDCTQIIRKLFGLDMVGTDYLWKEDHDNGRGQEASQGTDLSTAVRAESSG
jgi:hypothetical protein